MKKVKLLFEDNEKTPSSKLLAASYNGSEILFSGGASRIYRVLMENYNEYDLFIIFYDTVPNNHITIKWYDMLCQETNDMKNVFIIPIICIEYFILKMFVRYEYITYNAKTKNYIEYLVKDFRCDLLSEKEKTEVYLQSLEHIYKSILSNQNMKCVQNKNSDVNSLIGKFYKESCDCIQYHCQIKCMDSLQLKAERLYTTLPFYNINSNEYKKLLRELQIDVADITLTNVMADCKQFYNILCKNMDIPYIDISFG